MKNLSCLFVICFMSWIPLSINAQAPQWQWTTEMANYSSGADIEGWTIATDDAGYIYATGAFYGDSITIGASSYVSPGGGLYVIKYDTAGTIIWSRVDGGFGMNIPRGIATDASGNLFIAATFSEDSVVFGSTILYNTSAPNQDICVVKYDTNGNILWVVSAGSTSNEWVESADVDQHGNLWVTGSFDADSLTLGSSVLVNTDPSTEDIYLMKMDVNGMILWAVKAGGIDYEWPTAVTGDAFGNAIISGVYWSDSLIFNGTTSLVSPYGVNHDQLFVAKYDSTGNLNWARQVLLTEQGYDSYFYDVAADAFGNIFAIGSCISDTIFVDTQELVSSPQSFRDMLVVKYNPAGLVQWARRETGTGNVYGFDLAVNSSGEAYATGYFDCDSIIFGNDTTLIIDQYFYSDMFLVKYQPAGNVEWATNVGGTYMPGSWGYKQFGVACDDAGRVSVTGTFVNDSVAFGTNYLMLNNSYPNTYVAMLNDADACGAAFTLVPDTAMLHHYWIINQATGTPPLNYLWDWGDGTTNTGAYPSHTYPVAAFYTICLTITDASGCTNTNCESNYLERPSENAALVDINVVASIPTGIPSAESGELKVFPNPVTDFLYISYSGGIDKIEICDIYGRTQTRSYSTIQSGRLGIDMSGYSSGIYFLRVYNGSDCTIKKFTVLNKAEN
ncbi:MAG: PKD domain-containing protein [Chitinophagales bacterium]